MHAVRARGLSVMVRAGVSAAAHAGAAMHVRAATRGGRGVAVFRVREAAGTAMGAPPQASVDGRRVSGCGVRRPGDGPTGPRVAVS